MMLELSTVMSVSTSHIRQTTAEWLDVQADKGPPSFIASTSHIRQTTAEWMDIQVDKGPPSLIVYHKNGYGFFVLVPTDEQLEAQPLEATYRYDLMGLLWIARHHKARWLELDRDVAPDKLLPQWDW